MSIWNGWHELCYFWRRLYNRYQCLLWLGSSSIICCQAKDSTQSFPKNHENVLPKNFTGNYNVINKISAGNCKRKAICSNLYFKATNTPLTTNPLHCSLDYTTEANEQVVERSVVERPSSARRANPSSIVERSTRFFFAWHRNGQFSVRRMLFFCQKWHQNPYCPYLNERYCHIQIWSFYGKRAICVLCSWTASGSP